MFDCFFGVLSKSHQYINRYQVFLWNLNHNDGGVIGHSNDTWICAIILKGAGGGFPFGVDAAFTSCSPTSLEGLFAFTIAKQLGEKVELV